MARRNNNTWQRTDTSPSRREAIYIPPEVLLAADDGCSKCVGANGSEVISFTDSMTSLRSDHWAVKECHGDEQPKDVGDSDAARHATTLPAAYPVASFDRNDLVLGRLLGRGNFCNVHEIRAMQGSGSNKIAMQQLLLWAGAYRFAIKQLHQAVHNEDKALFVADLHKEATCLQALAHPNIIKLRGTARLNSNSDYFLIMDRLYDTLRQRVCKWRHQHHAGGSLRHLLTGQANQQRAHRLLIAYDICDAIRYMHDRNMMHRDIKPSNMAFDEHDDIKLFDFGLARVLNPNEMRADETYCLTHMTGSMRFMGPEVLLGQHYNEKADVYSFTLVLWEMLALEQPYKMGFFTASIKTPSATSIDYASQHIQRVCHNHQRPPVKPFWSPSIREMLQRGWAASIQERCSMRQMQCMLRDEILRLRKGDVSNVSDLVCVQG
ncbi:hypothetical protein MPSEU_000550400 [Mayamaea pseudoterrestris]|nr:hypothetical protein MPSEU_000550400 [Mayamaea pseudoterrestris]